MHNIPRHKMTRGERNNNPGNIRESPGDKTQWKGERATDDDKAFEEYKTPDDGIRALAVVLLTYYGKYGFNTIYDIIDRWAPSIENNTSAYIQAVAKHMRITLKKNINATDILNLRDETTLFVLVKAIIQHENGRVSYTDAEIFRAVIRALAGR